MDLMWKRCFFMYFHVFGNKIKGFWVLKTTGNYENYEKYEKIRKNTKNTNKNTKNFEKVSKKRLFPQRHAPKQAWLIISCSSSLRAARATIHTRCIMYTRNEEKSLGATFWKFKLEHQNFDFWISTLWVFFVSSGMNSTSPNQLFKHNFELVQRIDHKYPLFKFAHTCGALDSHSLSLFSHSNYAVRSSR